MTFLMHKEHNVKYIVHLDNRAMSRKEKGKSKDIKRIYFIFEKHGRKSKDDNVFVKSITIDHIESII